ncbi:MAG: hypothetical protein ACE15F_20380 [bacterium]
MMEVHPGDILPRVETLGWAATCGPLKGSHGIDEVHGYAQARCLHHKGLSFTLAHPQRERGFLGAVFIDHFVELQTGGLEKVYTCRMSSENFLSQ